MPPTAIPTHPFDLALRALYMEMAAQAFPSPWIFRLLPRKAPPSLRFPVRGPQDTLISPEENGPKIQPFPKETPEAESTKATSHSPYIAFSSTRGQHQLRKARPPKGRGVRVLLN